MPTPTLDQDLARAFQATCAEFDALVTAPLDPKRVGFTLGKRNARSFDKLLERMFASEPRLTGEGIAVAAVGSFGRGALALKSDLDLRILTEDPAGSADVVEGILYPLWDAGISVGHQVVSIEELVEGAKTDLPSATCLLDWRHIAGDPNLSTQLRQRAFAGVFAPSELPRFVQRLQEEAAARHARFGGSVYLLEPDVRNGAGGLRELDLARWAAKARYGLGELDDLVRIGALIPTEARQLSEAAEKLWRIRNMLHARAGRRSDRLSFDRQEELSSTLGFGDPPEGVERMMSDYYRAARTISSGVDRLLPRIVPVTSRRRPKEEDLGQGFSLFGGCVTHAELSRLRAEPALSLSLVRQAVQVGAPLLPHARDAIARAAEEPAWCEALRADPAAADLFVHLLTTRRETELRRGTVLRELHDLGLLLAMIPEFSPVVGRVHHDVYHVYTVDVHSVAAVDRLAALARGDLANEFPLASRLAAEISRPRTLFIATLLHDVGKAIGGRDHSQRGAEMAEVILKRLDFSSDATEEVCRLILKHLTMYHVATRRDLDNPETIREFAKEVRDREGLRNLYLLTVADISTTSPTSMTSWKAGMLDELYIATEAYLRGHHADERRLESAASLVRDAAEALPARDDDDRAHRRGFLDEYLRSMPDRYVLANAPEAIVSHAELARARDASEDDVPVHVGLVPSRHHDAAEICVMASDRPGLLACMAAALAASRLTVLAAQVHSRRIGTKTEAVDLFWVRDRTSGEEGVAAALPRVARDLHEILSGAKDPKSIAPRPDRTRPRGPDVATRVVIDNRAAPEETVIEVTTADRPGLLFAISNTLFSLGLTISVAKISTEGTKVADVFYVQDSRGDKVLDPTKQRLVQAAILDAIDPSRETEDAAAAEAM